jgi:hypothetical protein
MGTITDSALPRAKNRSGDGVPVGRARKRVYIDAEEQKDIRYPFTRLAPQDRPEGLQHRIPGKHEHLLWARDEAEKDVAYWHPQLCYADERCYQGDNEIVGGS